MSAFGGKADIRRVGPECPLIAKSGPLDLGTLETGDSLGKLGFTLVLDAI